MCISMELVTAVLGDHGQRPLDDYGAIHCFTHIKFYFKIFGIQSGVLGLGKGYLFTNSKSTFTLSIGQYLLFKTSKSCPYLRGMFSKLGINLMN